MAARGLNGAEFYDLADQILQAGHRMRFHARGRSMLPFIQDGDLLEVAPLDSDRASCGDVLLVEASQKRVLAHRVVKTRQHDGKLTFLIKGDNCASPDGWFGLENILGRVVVVDRGSQLIELTSRSQSWRARMWILIAPWIPKFTWVPKWLSRYVRRALSGN